MSSQRLISKDNIGLEGRGEIESGSRQWEYQFDRNSNSA